MNKKKKVYDWSFFIHPILWPPSCVLCGTADDGELCPACVKSLVLNETACARCGVPLPHGSFQLCGSCQNQAPAFDSAFVPFRYESPMDYLLKELKFHNRLDLARIIGLLMAQHLAQASPRPELLVPVPLHRSRLRLRGFNQAVELARPLAKTLDIPVALHLCQRTRATETQSALTARSRAKNLREAFAASGNIEANHVAIVDDVVTTGSTVAELARCLKRAGVDRVDVWACARAAPPG